MFLDKEEQEISNKYTEQGFLINKISEDSSFKFITNFFEEQIKNIIPEILKKYQGLDIFEKIHEYIDYDKLNDFRISLIKSLHKNKDIRFHYYKITKKYLDIIVGNELAMQRRISLSIQCPNDDSSLLNVHADTWSGDSPFEVVAWIPLVDCKNTKSMFILPPKKTKKLYEKNFKEISDLNSLKLFNLIKKDLIWIDIKKGEYLIFNQNLPHGNVVNEENETRWSMNCRFKSVFSPYKEKKIGEFFEPITLRAASLDGMNYKLPKL